MLQSFWSIDLLKLFFNDVFASLYFLTRPVLLGVSVVGLCSCASSNMFVENTDSKSQLVGHYSIPKAIIKLDIVVEYHKSVLTDDDKLQSELVSVETTATPVFLAAFHHPVYYNPDVFSSDNLTIETDANGILKKVTIDSDDKSRAVVKSIAQLGTDVIKTASAFGGTPKSTFSEKNNIIKEEFTVYFDPYYSGQSHHPIIGGRKQLTFSVSTIEDTPPLRASTELISQSGGCNSGICYPLPTSRIISITESGGSVSYQVVTIPDYKSLVKIDLLRASAVKKEMVAEFDNGMLTSFKLGKPSEAEGIATIPLDVLGELFALPTELIQLKIDTTKKNKDVYDAQKDLIASQQALLKAISDAKEQQQSNGPARR